jgi:hypothetical protein
MQKLNIHAQLDFSNHGSKKSIRTIKGHVICRPGLVVCVNMESMNSLHESIKNEILRSGWSVKHKLKSNKKSYDYV